MSLTDRMIAKYSKKWGVSHEEAERKIKELLDKNLENPSNPEEKTPSLENLFPEPIGEISKKIQDINQAALSTAYTRRMLNTPPEDVAALRERIENINRIVGELKGGLENQIKQLTEKLEDKKRKEVREELLTELDNKMDPLRETLQNLTKKLESLEKGEEKTGSGGMKPEKIFEEAEKVASKAKSWLQKQGYRVESEKLSKNEVKKMIEEAQKQALMKLPPEELRKRLEQAGYKVVGGPLSWEQVEKMLKEEKRKAQEEAIDDKRVDAVANIVRDAVTKIIEMFKPAVEAYFSTPPEGTKQS